MKKKLWIDIRITTFNISNDEFMEFLSMSLQQAAQIFCICRHVHYKKKMKPPCMSACEKLYISDDTWLQKKIPWGVCALHINAIWDCATSSWFFILMIFF